MTGQRIVEQLKGVDRNRCMLVLVPILLLGLLFVSSPLKPEIEAEIVVRGPMEWS
jgi:hypothetical protein